MHRRGDHLADRAESTRQDVFESHARSFQPAKAKVCTLLSMGFERTHVRMVDRGNDGTYKMAKGKSRSKFTFIATDKMGRHFARPTQRHMGLSDGRLRFAAIRSSQKTRRMFP